MRWNVYNGIKVIANFDVPGGIDVQGFIRLMLRDIDTQVGGKLPYICLSPETKPNPKGFQFE